jgi:hypothetical protein
MLNLIFALIASYIPPAEAVLHDLDRDGRYETLQVGFVSAIDSAALAAAIDSVVVAGQSVALLPTASKTAQGSLSLGHAVPTALFYAKGDPKPHEVPLKAGDLASLLKFQTRDFARQSKEAAELGDGGLGVSPLCEAEGGAAQAQTQTQVSVQVSVFASEGTPLAEFQKNVPCGAFVRWDLKDSNNEPVASGTYIAKIKAKLLKNGKPLAEESLTRRWGVLWEKP